MTRGSMRPRSERQPYSLGLLNLIMDCRVKPGNDARCVAALCNSQAHSTERALVVLRELPGNQVVYETRAFNDGPNSDNAAVLSVMFQAAMQGFPNPPQGARRVDLQIPVAHE